MSRFRDPAGEADATRSAASCIVMQPGGAIVPKGFTVRLDDDQAAELEAVAEAAGVPISEPISEEIREAITARIQERRQDGEFRARLRQSIEDNRKILDRLAQ
jgi:hypothetical protein